MFVVINYHRCRVILIQISQERFGRFYVDAESLGQQNEQGQTKIQEEKKNLTKTFRYYIK